MEYIFYLSALLFLMSISVSMSVTSDEALQLFKDGNHRYSSGQTVYPVQSTKRKSITSIMEQHPLAIVLACSDSRVPIESVFDMGNGDVFVVRVAGNVCDSAVLGSLEYGAEQLEVPLLIVLGHTHCGAVTAAVQGGTPPGNLSDLLDKIKPAVNEAIFEHPNLQGDELILESVKLNVFLSIRDILTKSAIIRELVKDGKIKIVAGLYNIEIRDIEWMGPHPQESSFLQPV